MYISESPAQSTEKQKLNLTKLYSPGANSIFEKSLGLDSKCDSERDSEKTVKETSANLNVPSNKGNYCNLDSL